MQHAGHTSVVELWSTESQTTVNALVYRGQHGHSVVKACGRSVVKVRSKHVGIDEARTCVEDDSAQQFLELLVEKDADAIVREELQLPSHNTNSTSVSATACKALELASHTGLAVSIPTPHAKNSS
eukprot:80543-Rhodomonas_salina.1